MKESLEDKLKSLRGPTMPPDVEERVRRRLAQAAPDHPLQKARRDSRRNSRGKLILLALLMTLAGWVVVHNVVPVLRSAWERTMCLPAGSNKKP